MGLNGALITDDSTNRTFCVLYTELFSSLLFSLLHIENNPWHGCVRPAKFMQSR